MNKKELKQAIDGDLFRYTAGEKTDFIHRIHLYGYVYSSALRKASYYHEKRNLPMFFFYRLKLRNLSFKYGFQIPYTTKIGSGLYIGHHGTVIVSPMATLGNNVNLSPGTVIGATSRGSRKGAPQLGNSVWVGSNAVIVGRVQVGDNVLIAPGAYVNIDIPDNSIVIGNPCTVHHSDTATDEYVNYKV